MASLPIIPETTLNVTPQASNFGAKVSNLGINTSIVAVLRCEAFDSSPYASNEQQAQRMAFQWHGDDIATFDNELHQLIERNKHQVTFSHLEQPATRVIIDAPLLDSIIARSTFNLATHNGEITFTNGKVYTFRAFTEKTGDRVIQEKRGKKKWKAFGAINADGTVTPIISSSLIEVAADNDPRFAEATANAQKKINAIEAKAKLLNEPSYAVANGVSISFAGKCRCCNRRLTNPKSVASGIGPVCEEKQIQAAVAIHTISTPAQVDIAIIESDKIAATHGDAAADDRFDEIMSVGSTTVFKSLVDMVEDFVNQANIEDLRAFEQDLQDFEFEGDEALPLNAEQILFCTSQLGVMGCSDAEVERFFDDILTYAPYWYPFLEEELAKRSESPGLLFDVCDAFVDSITPIDKHIPINGGLYRYQRDAHGYEWTTFVGHQNGELVDFVVYPDEVQVIKDAALTWM